MGHSRFAISWVLLFLVIGALAVSAQTRAAAKSITVYKSPTWGCCSGWGSHLEKNGFKVENKSISGKAFDDLKQRYGVPEKLRTCHTALVDGYVIEGHVPVDLINKLLKEKPAVVGLAVPGMPGGSPGMEGAKPEPYDVLAFDKTGKTTVYAKR